MSERHDPELWCVDLAAAGEALQAAERAVPRLSAADNERADAFSDSAARGQWLSARIALRLVIERAAGRQWRGVAFAHGERGKPHLAGAPITFSLSHTKGMALIGIARQGCIGVDVEHPRDVRIEGERRARIIEAGASLTSAPLPAADGDRFLQAWVRLEAFAKAEGCGIGRLLTQLVVFGRGSRADAPPEETRQRVAELLSGAAARHVGDLPLGGRLYAAVACSEPPAAAVVRWLPSSLDGLERALN